MLQVQLQGLALTAAVRSHQENSIGHDQHRVRAGLEGAAVILKCAAVILKVTVKCKHTSEQRVWV